MSSIQGPAGTGHKTPGRKAVPIGVTLIVVSIAVGIVGSALTIPKFEDTLSREVIVTGEPNPRVPGRLAFRVASSVSGDANAPMTVGVAVDSEAFPQPTCELQTSEGDQVGLKLPSPDAMLFRSDATGYRVVGLAHLRPGSYVAICGHEGDGTQGGARFTVGHAFDSSNLGAFAPIFWFIGVVVVAGILFLIGAITLTVGLIRRGRAKRQMSAWSSGGPYPGGPYPPGGYQGGQPAPGATFPGYSGGTTSPGYPGSTPSGYPPPPVPPPAPGTNPAPTGPPPAPGTTQTPGGTPPTPGQGGGEPDYPWRTPQGGSGSGTADADRPSPPSSPPSGWTIPPSKR